MQNQSFQLLIDGVPYNVNADPFKFNEGVRYKVQYNESPTFIFAWDDSAMQYLAIDTDASKVPSNVEFAIARQLEKLNEKITM